MCEPEQPFAGVVRGAAKANWATPADIKRHHRNVGFLGNSRVVFNIGGNKYRLVAALKYEARITFVRFVGTHAQYDKIDSEKVLPAPPPIGPYNIT
jgi:mRNA interferase HigB